MPLLSAYEDFSQRSLARLANVWEKLFFVVGLRSGEGYSHWGLEDTFGSAAAKEAMARAHAELRETVASTPLFELWHALKTAPSQQGTPVSETANSVLNSQPADLRGVPAEHIQFICRSLSRLDHAQAATSRLAA